MPRLRKLNKPSYRRIDIRRPAELRAWAKYWGCTPQDIRDAVKNSGVMVADVSHWLKINVAR